MSDSSSGSGGRQDQAGVGRLPRWARIVLGLIAAVLVVWILFTVVFPRVDAILDDPAVGTTSIVMLPGG